MSEYYVKLKGPDVKFEDFEDFVKKNGGTVVSKSLSKFAPHAVIKVKEGEGFASDLASNPNSLAEKHPEIVQYVEPNGEMKTQ